MPTLHLICGSTGAGKTTFAIELARRTGAIRFSIDEWMASLFVADWPPGAKVEWALERTARCEAQMWRLAEQLLPKGLDLVLDLGLSKREHRDRIRAVAARLGATTKVHFLDVEVETRRQRVRQRNAERTASFAFEVTEEMFEFMEGWFEPPTPDEL